jgi:hypothetical protein
MFDCTFHDVLIFPLADPKAKTRMLPFCITKLDIQQVVTKWPEKLRSTPDDDLEQLETRSKR